MSRDGNGVTVSGKIVLQLEYDCVTHQVVISGDPMQVSLAQMICDEGSRLLMEQRRAAASMQIARAMAEQARAQEIANRVSGGRH
jgi:hypothetical protein